MCRHKFPRENAKNDEETRRLHCNNMRHRRRRRFTRRFFFSSSSVFCGAYLHCVSWFFFSSFFFRFRANFLRKSFVFMLYVPTSAVPSLNPRMRVYTYCIVQSLKAARCFPSLLSKFFFSLTNHELFLNLFPYPFFFFFFSYR